MITIIYGLDKDSVLKACLAQKLLPAFLKNRAVATNLPLELSAVCRSLPGHNVFLTRLDSSDLLNQCAQVVLAIAHEKLLVIEDSDRLFNSTLWATNAHAIRGLIDAVIQHRRYGVEVVLLASSLQSIDGQLARLATELWQVTPIPTGLTLSPFYAKFLSLLGFRSMVRVTCRSGSVIKRFFQREWKRSDSHFFATISDPIASRESDHSGKIACPSKTKHEKPH